MNSKFLFNSPYACVKHAEISVYYNKQKDVLSEVLAVVKQGLITYVTSLLLAVFRAGGTKVELQTRTLAATKKLRLPSCEAFVSDLPAALAKRVQDALKFR